MSTTTAANVEPQGSEELKAPGYEIFIGLLAVISIINFAIWLLPFDPDTKAVANIIDVPLTLIFLADFGSRLRASHPRRVYFIDQRGWLDLLGSLPAFFKLFRIFRLVRVYRLLVAYGINNVIRTFIKDRANNALLVVVFVVVVILEFGSMLVLYFEADAPGANITTGADAVWWAFVSITTVGYGDQFPVTGAGRLAAFFVLAAGVGLFGVLSGFLANFFLAPAVADPESTADPAPAAESAPAAATDTTQRALGDERAEIMRMVDELEAGVSALRARLAEPVEPSGGS